MKLKIDIKDNDFILLLAGASLVVSTQSLVVGNNEASITAGIMTLVLLVVSWVRFE